VPTRFENRAPTPVALQVVCYQLVISGFARRDPGRRPGRKGTCVLFADKDRDNRLASENADAYHDRMKKYLIGSLVVALVAVGWWFGGGGDAPVAPRTEKVKRGELVSAVSAAGTVEANFMVEIKSKASGEILSFPHEPGDAVKAGEEMIRLDPKTERRNLERAAADVASATAAVKSAESALLERRAKLKRAEQLMGRKIIAAQDYEEAKASALASEAQLIEAQAARKRAEVAAADAKERLDETVIASPIDGVVVAKTVEPGQIISSGISSFTGGTTLATVADLSKMFVMAQVDETDIGAVFEGQEAQVTVDAYRDKVFVGQVVRIHPMGKVENNITVFEVKVEVDDPLRDMLRPAMSANVDLIVEKADDVLYVPSEGVVPGSDGEKPHLFVVGGGDEERREVTTGLTNGFETAILSGVVEGEEVLLSPPNDR
jgi:HlyD family secretion protein